MTDMQTRTDFDAIVIGAGFGGIYMLHKLRNELGLSVRIFDRAGGIGGTWYWNRYPGAKSDTESFVYRYSFDQDLLQEWSWEHSYLEQPEILAYLEHVVQRYELGRDIQLNTGVTAAYFDEDRTLWEIRTETGEVFTARYLVNAVGLLAATYLPDIPGADTFAGELLHTGAWPADEDLTGKRVGVIGTGSTGTQFICAAAPQVEHLTVFQRTPQYSVPSGKRPVDAAELAEIKKNYDQTWEHVRNSTTAFGIKESTVPAMSVSEQERQRVFQENWERGNGFRFMFGTFSDITTDPDANEAAASFIRSKIAEIVKDPETARKLTPTGLYAKRPLCNEGYYETYNRDNVSLVDIKENPIIEITPNGVRTEDDMEHELDVLVLATGFDAVDGNYRRMDLRGRGGQHISEHWQDAPTSYLGIATTGFPNMFMILGPNGPFTNLMTALEVQVEGISDLIGDAEQANVAVVEATQEAEDNWTAICREVANATLFPQSQSWIFGGNISGKTNTVMFYLAGMSAYRQQLIEVRDNDYTGFHLQKDAQPVST
ncbi:flavin-containing monooxygenase [Bounagaea algeriensis]